MPISVSRKLGFLNEDYSVGFFHQRIYEKASACLSVCLKILDDVIVSVNIVLMQSLIFFDNC